MKASITKKYLLDQISQLENYEANQNNGIKSNSQLYNDIKCDLVKLFNLTQDGETWNHIEGIENSTYFLRHGIIIKSAVYNVILENNSFNSISECAERYFSQETFRNNELDWFYFDFVTAAQYQVSKEKYNDLAFSNSYPTLNSAINKFNGSNYSVLFLYLFKKLLKYTILLIFLFSIFILPYNVKTFFIIITTGLIAFKIGKWVYQLVRYSNFHKDSNKKIQLIAKLYDLCSEGIVRWEIIEEDIKQLRISNIDFPISLHIAAVRHNK